jgi:molecular chaperone GrpE (heat shock protein)
VRIAFERNARRQLNVTKDQDRQISQIEREHQQRLQKLMEAMQKAGKRPTSPTSEMLEAVKTTDDALAKVLSEAQVQQIKAAGGQTFVFRPELGNFAELPVPGGPR